MKMGVGMTTAGFAWLYPLRFAGDGGNHRGIAPTRGCGMLPDRVRGDFTLTFVLSHQGGGAAEAPLRGK